MRYDAATKQKIQELRQEEMIPWLKRKMTTCIEEGLEYTAKYDHFLTEDVPELRLLYGEYLKDKIKEIIKIQSRIIGMKTQGRPGQITDEMIQIAKDKPFEEVYEFKRGMCLCPFHADKTPSMTIWKAKNRVQCFSCHKSWDTIAFVQDLEGISFAEAVRKLQC